jgi:hypothetical protein
MSAVPIVSVLKNPEILLSALGHAPRFHDTEVISLRLDRYGRDEWEGPVLWVEIHLFDGRMDPRTRNGVAWFNHKRVTFRFANVALLELRGFNQQNGIDDLVITKTSDRSPDFGMGDERYRVEIIQSFGLGASFICGGIEIAAVVDGAPPGSAYCDERSGNSA